MDLEGQPPPTLEEIFQEVEAEREATRIDNVNLRVINKRLARQVAELEKLKSECARDKAYIQALELRVAELEIALEEARGAMSDTAPGDGVGSDAPAEDPTEKEKS